MCVQSLIFIVVLLVQFYYVALEHLPLERVIDCVDRNMWIDKVVYDPNKSFIHQIQENHDMKGMTFLYNRFTQLQINNLIIRINCKTAVPYHISRYNLIAYIKEGSKLEHITFKLLNDNEFYVSSFDGIEEVDNFLKRVYNEGNISYWSAMAWKNIFDEKIRLQEREYKAQWNTME